MSTLAEEAAAPRPAAESAPPFREALGVWVKIGLLSFGGPAGQIALMHRLLVEERRWIGEQRFLHALNYCMLLPGPEAMQLATYTGWLLHRTLGGLFAGLLFVLPGALVMLGLSLLYFLYGRLPLVEAAFFGIKAAVLAVVVEALLRIGRRALKGRFAVGVAALAFLAIFVFQVPFPLIVLAAGIAGWLFARRRNGRAGGTAAETAPGLVDRLFEQGALQHTQPSRRRALTALGVWLPLWLGPVAILWLVFGWAGLWTQIATFFSTLAVVTFGGAYAVLAYVAQAAVESYGWLTPAQILDGLGLAETTPGPLILVLQFVGFLAAAGHAAGLDPVLAGCLGAALTLWVTFAPCFLWIFLGAPYVEQLRGRPAIAAALAAITAAVVGVVLNLALWFALHVIFTELRPVQLFGVGPDLPVLASIDWRAALLSLGAMVAMLRFKAGMLPTLAVSAALGLVLVGLGL